MRLRLTLYAISCASSIACAVATGRGSVEATADNGFAAVMRTLVVDSARVGAGRIEQPVTAADSSTSRLLVEAGVPTTPLVAGQELLCPASTLANGEPPPGPRGYFVNVKVMPATSDPNNSALREVHITHSCRFMFRGEFLRGGTFRAGARWELSLRDGRWQITRSLGRSIT